MSHPVEFNRPPDGTRYATNFFGSSWAAVAGMASRGTQASFDFLTDGQTDRGLRAFIERSVSAAEAGNGITVNITAGSSLSLAWSAANRALTGTIAASTTVSQLRTAINGLTGTPFGTSAYFGAETGTGATPDAGYAGVLSGGTPDPWGWIIVKNEDISGDPGLFQVTNAAPTAVTAARACPRYVPVSQIIRPGDALYVIRQGGSDINGSAAVWWMSEGERIKYGG